MKPYRWTKSRATEALSPRAMRPDNELITNVNFQDFADVLSWTACLKMLIRKIVAQCGVRRHGDQTQTIIRCNGVSH